MAYSQEIYTHVQFGPINGGILFSVFGPINGGIFAAYVISDTETLCFPTCKVRSDFKTGLILSYAFQPFALPGLRPRQASQVPSAVCALYWCQQ